MYRTSILLNPLNSFGSILEGRNYEGDTSLRYRFGFNGKEKDFEVKEDGTVQDYGFRIYDGRFGRFLSIDPLTSSYPWYTPYQFAGNTPIQASDLDGLEPDFRGKDGQVEDARIKSSPDPKTYGWQYDAKNDQWNNVGVSLKEVTSTSFRIPPIGAFKSKPNKFSLGEMKFELSKTEKDAIENVGKAGILLHDKIYDKSGYWIGLTKQSLSWRSYDKSKFAGNGHTWNVSGKIKGAGQLYETYKNLESTQKVLFGNEEKQMEGRRELVWTGTKLILWRTAPYAAFAAEGLEIMYPTEDEIKQMEVNNMAFREKYLNDPKAVDFMMQLRYSQMMNKQLEFKQGR